VAYNSRWFPWFLYIGSALLYTALTFRGEIPTKDAQILSKHNSRSAIEIITIHIVFLASLLFCIKFARLMQPKLPSWLMNPVATLGPPISMLQFLFIVAAVGMHFLERRLLFVPAETKANDGPCR